MSLCAALAAAPAALAQAPDPSPTPDPPRYEESLEVEAVLAIPPVGSTFTKGALELELTPASISVVGGALIESQDSRVLGDALRNVSGVNLGTGFGTFDQFTVRGFDSLSTGLILTDAAFEPESTFYPLYNVSRVEVLKGPSAFLYGANPLSGTVNLVRKEPAADRFADIALSAGSFDTYEGRFDGNLAGRDGKTSFRLNGFYRDSAGWRDGIDSTHLAFNPSFTWIPDSKTSLTLNFEYVDAEYSPDSGIPVAGDELTDVPFERSYQSPFDASDQAIYRYRADFQRHFGRWTLRNKLYFTDFSWKSDGTILNGVFALPIPGFPTQVFRTFTSLDDAQKMFGNQLEAVVPFATGAVRHELLAGFEVARLTDEFTLGVFGLPTIGLDDPVETAALPLQPIPGQDQRGDTRALTLAPYLLDQIQVGSKLRLLVGARFDALDYDDAATGTSRDENQLSPLLGALVQATPELSLYANFGRAFGPPSTLIVGERKAERATQLEGGLKLRLFGGRLYASAAGYEIERENMAIPDASGITREIGSQRSRGVEVELAGELAEGLRLWGSYAFNDSELVEFRESVFLPTNPPSIAVLDRSGNVPSFAPRNIASAWLEKQWPSGLSLAGGARYVCSHYIAEDNAFLVPSYTLLDAAVGYRVGRAKLQLNFKNIAGEEYLTRGFSNTSVIPGAPFAVYGSLSVSAGR